MTRAEILRALRANVITVERAKELLSPRTPDARAAGEAARGGDARSPDRVAIISAAGRFPGANDVEAFWSNLRSARDCVVEVPPDRWDHGRYFSDARGEPGKSYCRWGGFIDDVDCFDPSFFRISPREARLIDPQERLLLQVVWTLFERVGYTRRAIAERFGGKAGVFTASMYHQYHSIDAELATKATIAMSSHASIANRVSNFFGLTGPSVAVDTMCSSAGTALHMACQSLLHGESTLAVVGAANLSIHPYKYVALSQATLLASRRDARSFADGDGFLPAEAVAAVLLKRLDRAVADGDPVLAVISSTAVNHKGYSDGFNTPTPDAIADLIAENHAKAGVPPSAVSYVECAAAGAPLADAAELEALRRVYAGAAHAAGSCGIGSVKSNIGHPEAASGLCQLIKVALQLHHRYLVPTLYSDPLNPKINLDATPLYLQREGQPWPEPNGAADAREGSPRRAAIHTLGAGGSNTHVLLEEFRSEPGRAERTAAEVPPQILVFSARTQDRLVAVVRSIVEHLTQHPPPALDVLAYSLQLGREEMPARAALVVANLASLPSRLHDCLRALTEPAETRSPAVFFHDLGESVPADAGARMHLALADRDLEAIAREWTRGGPVPWQDLHRRGETPVRHAHFPLPTYPFVKLRCWLPSTSATAATAAAAAPHHGAAGERHATDEASPAATESPPPPPPEVALSGGAESPADAERREDPRQVVLAEISKLTGLELGSFHSHQPLSDLGLNSVTKLILVTSLCLALPSYLSETRDGARLVACGSADELIEGIRTPRGERPPSGEATDHAGVAAGERRPNGGTNGHSARHDGAAPGERRRNGRSFLDGDDVGGPGERGGDGPAVRGGAGPGERRRNGHSTGEGVSFGEHWAARGGSVETDASQRGTYFFRFGGVDLRELDPRPLEHGALVLGAGPGGLMAALTLRRSGIDPVVVVEKRQAINRMQMITLYQHTLPYLRRVGILDRIVARAAFIRHHDFYFNRGGTRHKYYTVAIDRTLLERVDGAMDYGKARINDQFVGESVLAISLADLQDALMQEVLAAGVTVVSETTAELERDAAASGYGVRLRSDAGSAVATVAARPKLIVIADGKQSRSAVAAGVRYSELESSRGTESWYVFHCETDRRESCLCYEFSFDARDELTDCAFGLFYPQRSEFGVALYRSTPEPPSRAFLEEKAQFFASSQQASFGGVKWQSKRIDVKLTGASALAVDNVVLTGDAAGTGSPNAGLGAVLAISAYGWALQQYCDLARRDRGEAIAFYNEAAREYARNWQSRSRHIWSRILDLTNLVGGGAVRDEALIL